MTSIAFDGTTLAADGQTTVGNVVFERNSNKLIPLHEIPYRGDTLLYAAMCGECTWINKCTEVLLGRLDPEEIRDHKCDGIVIGTNRIYWFGAKDLVLTPSDEPYLAEGSGHQFVLSALSLGMSAVEAVKHAAQFDIYTNDNVSSIKLR